MNDGASAKQQIVERIKNSTSILVTVSTDPSVDELSAALGLTLLLNKIKKHATAVVSGELPPAITFLDPEKTFESSVDSLRDFIIALDKEKADHLRYKVDGDVVKIFITPYRTTITSDDLEFSQGDYNVELVLALGVENNDHLDSALSAHGRILHDATVVTLTAGDQVSQLGSVDWHDSNASSLSEMLVSLSESLKSDKPLLDEQIATAFLTGIVAATDRFSNTHTSSRVMTMAAQLMAAGANQQLIAAKLQEAHEIGITSTDADSDDTVTPDSVDSNNDGTTDLSEGESTKLDKQPRKDKLKKDQPKPKKDDGALVISHEKEGTIEQVGAEVATENQANAAKEAEEQLAAQLQASSIAPAVAAVPSVDDLQKDLAAASAEVDQAASQPSIASQPSPSGAVQDTEWHQADEMKEEPSLGGTLNATTEEAADTARRDTQKDRNKKILSHGEYLGNSQPMFDSPINGVNADSEEPTIDPFGTSSTAVTAKAPAVPAAAVVVGDPALQSEPTTPTLAELDARNRAPHDEARAAVDAALAASPVASQQQAPLFSSPVQPPAPAQPTLPPLPDFATLPPLPPVPSFGQPSGALPADQLGDIFASDSPAPAPPVSPAPPDPGQFKIPGQ